MKFSEVQRNYVIAMKESAKYNKNKGHTTMEHNHTN